MSRGSIRRGTLEYAMPRCLKPAIALLALTAALGAAAAPRV
jgi:hypothetical protein